MSQVSSIEWTDGTWNPVTGCTKVSPGCKHCYAETFAERFRGVPGHHFEQGFDLRLWPDRIELPLTWKTPRRIFVNSMSDLFHERVPESFVAQVFDTMRLANWHVYQVLTKRPERMVEFVRGYRNLHGSLRVRMPHVWLGASVESQPYVSRAVAIAGLDTAVRFLSCEPLLGPLDLSEVLHSSRGVNWVIVGGESGPGARNMNRDWAREIRRQCRIAHVPFFFKQWGGVNKKRTGRVLDGRTYDDAPVGTATEP